MMIRQQLCQHYDQHSEMNHDFGWLSIDWLLSMVSMDVVVHRRFSPEDSDYDGKGDEHRPH